MPSAADIEAVRSIAHQGVVKLVLLPRRLHRLPPRERASLLKAAGVIDSEEHARREHLKTLLDIIRDPDTTRRKMSPSAFQRARTELNAVLGPPERRGASDAHRRAYVMRLTRYLVAVRDSGAADPGVYAERLGVQRGTVSEWNRVLGLDLTGKLPSAIRELASGRLRRAIAPERDTEVVES